MEWVNRLGLVLEFLSFWFAAPEILGEERLRALEQRIEQGLKVSRSGVLWVGLMAIAPFVLLAAVPLRLWNRIRSHYKREPWWRIFGLSDEGQEVEAVAVAGLAGWFLLICLALSSAVLTLAGAVGWLPVDWRFMLKVTLALSVPVLAGAVGESVLFLLIGRIIEPLLRTLADDARIRQRSLAVGAVLFVIGFLLQLVATF